MSKGGQEELHNLGVALKENRHSHHPSPLRDDEALSPQTARHFLMLEQLSGHLGCVSRGIWYLGVQWGSESLVLIGEYS